MSFSYAALNATLNGTSGILLAGGYAAIRTGKREAHKRFVISAFVVSCAFLVSYLVYHYRVGHAVFQGQGWIRPVYFCTADVAHHSGDRDCAVDSDYAAAWVGGAL